MSVPSDDRLLFLMSRSQHVLKNYLARRFGEAGVKISPAQMGILFLLKIRNDRQMSELGRELYIDNSAVTGLVDRLEKSGYLERIADHGDRRKYLVRITAEGFREAERAAAVARRVNEEIKEGFSEEEIGAFKRVLASFQDKFGPGSQ